MTLHFCASTVLLLLQIFLRRTFAQRNVSASYCVSLMTYRQFSTVLEDAPSCFRSGCSSKNPSTSISSTCEEDSPCFPLWSVIKDHFTLEPYSLDECANSHAVRISGWPLFNSTEACDFVPVSENPEWLFGGGGDPETCCSFGNEPHELARWVRTVCDDNWKEQFFYYDNMARLDWIEWISPWNWTIQPKNEYGQVLPTSCPGTMATVWLFIAENAIVVLLYTLLGNRHILHAASLGLFSDRYEPTVKRALILAVVMALFGLGFEFLATIALKRSPGYGHVDIVLITLLFCTRPRVTWVIPLLFAYAADPRGDSQYMKNRQKTLLGKKLKANVYLDFALSTVVAEFILHMISAYTFGRAVHYGARKKFFLANHLTPFYRGKDAYLMYVGALLWMIIALALFVLIIITVATLSFLAKAYRRMKEEYRIFKREHPELVHKLSIPKPQLPFEKLKAFIGKTWIERMFETVKVPFNKFGEKIADSFKKKKDKHNLNRYRRRYHNPKDPDSKEMRERKLYEKRASQICLFCGIILFFAFICQFMFWVGFLNVARERYCPPKEKLPLFGAVWGVGELVVSLLGVQ